MDIDIFQLPGILRKRWLYIVVTALLCAGLAAAYVAVRKPVYLATTNILIDPQGLAATPPDPNQLRTGGQDEGVLESQLFVLQSRELLNQVVDELDLREDRFLNPSGLAEKDMAQVAAVGALQKNLMV